MRMLFLPPLLLPTVRPLIFPLVSLVPSHSWTLPPLPSATLPPLLHLFLSSPALFLHRCFLISAVSVSSFTTPRWCDDAVLAASQTPTNFAPPPPHLPPDAINTQHRWVIAQTYQLPLSLLSASPSSPPHHPLSLCSSSLTDLTHFPTSTLAPAPQWPSWAKPRPGTEQPAVRECEARGQPNTLPAKKPKNKTSMKQRINTINQNFTASHSSTSQLVNGKCHHLPKKHVHI